jgi:hypothetical protein
MNKCFWLRDYFLALCQQRCYEVFGIQESVNCNLLIKKSK